MPNLLPDYLDELTARGDERAVYVVVGAPEGVNHISPAAMQSPYAGDGDAN